MGDAVRLSLPSVSIPRPVGEAAQPAGAEWGRRAKFILGETAGGLGDLGTFIPIVLGMVHLAGFDAGTILVFAGAAHVLTGLVFRAPIPVQPMKALCALAIAGTLTADEVAAAGLFVGACVLVVGAFGLARRLDRLIPRDVVRALQAAVGLKLVMAAFRMGLFETDALRPLLGSGGLLVFLGGALIAAALARKQRRALPVLLALGLVAVILAPPPDAPGWSLWRPGIALPQASALSGLWRGGLAQLPLTLLNSVLAVSLLAGDLFPDRADRTGPGRIAVSVGLMNLIACPFGAMPMCHGSGGLAAQHRCGARTGVSMVILGGAKLATGLFLGVAAMPWVRAFPETVLAVFLLIAGTGLVSVSRVWRSGRTLAAAAAMVGLALATSELALGFAAGWIVFAAARRPATGVTR
jgi:MFS superfamily sulfate permease-like transporter